MSLDQIETLTIAPPTSLRGLFLDPVTAPTGAGVQIEVEDVAPISETNIILLQRGHRGLDMPSPVVVTRPVPAGVGEVQTILRPRSRRFSLRLSAYIGNDQEYNKLVNAIAPGFPFTLKVSYKSASGKTARALPLCYYTGGLERQRRVSGRTEFNLNFYTEYPYFVSGHSQAAGSLDASNIRDRAVVWGVAATSDTTQLAQVRVKIGAPLVANDPDAWRWQWNPPGETPPATPFGTTNPSGLAVCFAPPYQGVWGIRAGTPLGAIDVSSGRVSGKQLPALLPTSPQTIQIDGAGMNVWYWRDYAGI